MSDISQLYCNPLQVWNFDNKVHVNDNLQLPHNNKKGFLKVRPMVLVRNELFLKLHTGKRNLNFD